jgi:hypothetical protein
MDLGISDGESNGHCVEKSGRLGKVIADMKRKLECPGGKLHAFEQWTIGAAVGVGHDGRDERSLASEAMQFNAHAGGGTSASRVEDVSS